MGLFDSIKETAKSAYDSAKTQVQQANEKKAEKAKIAAEEQENANRQAQAEKEELTSLILNNQKEAKGIFELNSMDDTIKFTKEYMTKLLLPASSFSNAKLCMLPYTMEKIALRSIKKIFADYDESETILFFLKNKKGNQYMIVTTSYLYCSLPCKAMPSVTYEVKIPLGNISSITFDEEYNIFCNDVLLMTFLVETRPYDYINLKYYFECLEKSDFEITDEEIDKLIHEKVGDEAYNSARKYMDDDEKIIYFAWGLDSLTAKDYLMCTTKQFVRIDRELMGMAQNVKQFYYDDILSMSVQQDNGGGLTGMVLNAALALCDMIIYVAGTQLVIRTLSTVEAERVIQVFNYYKKLSKEEAKKPISVVMEKSGTEQIDPLEQLGKLQKLKEAGVLTEEEFNVKKAELLSKI